MKNLATIIFILIVSQAKAQDFGAVGTEWFYGRDVHFLDSSIIEDGEYWHIKSVADTVILNKPVHKLINTLYRFTGTHISTFSFNIYVYQEADTVFFTQGGQEFLTLFIFNRDVGDTITLDNPYLYYYSNVSKYVIESVSTEIIDGIPLKKFKVRSLDIFTFVGSYFMERIGGLGWFFPVMEPHPDRNGPLRCFYDDEISENFWGRSCDLLVTGVEHEYLSEKNPIIYPNPANRKATVILPADAHISGLRSMRITNIAGREVKTAEFSGAGTAVDVSQLPQGVYLVTVTNAQGQRWQQKLVVQR